MIQLIPYPKQCKNTQGGFKRLFLLPYMKYRPYQIRVSGMNLDSFPLNYGFKMDCTGSFSQNSETEGGSLSFSHSVSVDLPKIYNVTDIQKFLKQDLRCIIQTNNNEYLMAGTHNGLTATVSSSSGTSKNSFNGFKLDLKGQEEYPMLLVENLNSFLNLQISEEDLSNNLNFNI
jgi:hypothetical protein